MIVPWQDISADALDNLIQEFVTRDGTDYGEHEVTLETKVAQVHRQLERGEVLVWFDDVTETVTLLTRDQAAAISPPS